MDFEGHVPESLLFFHTYLVQFCEAIVDSKISIIVAGNIVERPGPYHESLGAIKIDRGEIGEVLND